MSSTVIDQLIVKLGLDTKDFKKGKDEASKDLKDTSATVVNTAGSMVSALRRVTTEFIGMFLAVRGVSDIVHMFVGLNESVRQLGIDSKNLGTAAGELRDWQEVAELAGGSAEDATRSISGLQQSIFNLKFKGEISDQLMMLARLGIGFDTATGAMRPFKDLAMDTAKALDNQGWDEATKYQYALAAGFSGGLATAISEGSRALSDYYTKAEAAHQITQKQTDAAQKLGDAWIGLKYDLSGAATQILTNLTPSLIGLFQHLEAIGPAKLQQIADWVKGDGAKSISTFFTDLNIIISGVAKSFEAIGRAISFWQHPGSAFSRAFKNMQIEAAQKNFNVAAAYQKSLSPSDPHYKEAQDRTHLYGEHLQIMLEQSAQDDQDLADATPPPADGILASLGKILTQNSPTLSPVEQAAVRAERKKYEPALTAAEKRYNIPTGLLHSIAEQESGYRPDVISGQRTSDKGAVGLMQLLPQYHPNAGKDPLDDIDEGGKELARLYKQFGSWDKAVEAYNAGAGRIAKVNAGTATMPAETAGYHNRVMAGAPLAALQNTPQATPDVQQTPSQSHDNSVNVDKITVITQATDATSMATDVYRAIQRKWIAATAETGIV